MRGFLLAVAVFATIALSTAEDQECVQRRIRGLPVHWPNPTDCSSFYRCTNKNIRRELLCPEGKEYNPKTGRCGSKVKNLCQLSLIAPLAAATNPCAVEISGIYVADPKSCRGFHICNNNLAYPQTCDAGSYFNTKTLACETDAESLCWENLCVKKANAVYIEDGSNCHDFYICYEEKPVSQKCPKGSYFNVNSSNCQPGQCPSEETSTTTYAPETTTTTTCAPESTTTTVTTTTTCAAQTTTTTYAPETTTTTTCAPESTTTTITTTTTCAAQTTTTTCAIETQKTTTPETTTPCVATTTCAPEKTTTSADTEYDFSSLNCDTTKCKNAKDGFLFAAQNTNAGFCVCLKQKPQYHECPDNGLYNESHFICVALDKVCASRKCSQYSDYSTFPASNTTTGFCRCLNGKASYLNCAERDYVYNNELGFCVKSSNSGDFEQEKKSCQGGYSEGNFVPNPDNCMLFYICYEGELVESSCEPGNYYDGQIKACLTDSEGKCTASREPITTRNRRSVRASNCVEGVKLPAVDCDKYYKCSHGQKLLYGCGKDNFFNVTTLSCQFDVQHICWPANTCVNGEKTPNLSDKQKYYDCVNGVQVEKSCLTNQYFDKLSKTCKENEECTCPDGYQEGDISPHPNDCDKFYIYTNGEQVLHECGTGNYFDQKTLSCEKDIENECKFSAPDNCPCSDSYEEGDLLAHPQDCDKYYICVDGKQVLKECGDNNYFDKSTLTCQQDINDECWTKEACTCPGGYKERDLSAHPTDCSKYYICQGGHQVLGDCGTNNYFNKDSLICEFDTYHVCWPNLCAAQPNGALVANPQQCNAFFLCENQETIPYECLEGQYLDAEVSACVADLKAQCYNPCEKETAGPVVLLPHPVCNKYYFCNGRKTFVGTCEVGSFDIETGVCNPNKKCLPNPCQSASIKTFPDPYDPTKFFYCQNGMPTSTSCEAGKEYSVKYDTCLKVSDSDCPHCTEDGLYPTLDDDNDSEFCVCDNGIGTKIECPKDYVFNIEIGSCYSNAPCDPSFCLENKEYTVAPNRNGSKSFCMCIGQKASIIDCPNNGTFNPYILKCSDYEISRECLQAECINKPDTYVFKPITPKTSNGFCQCINQIATFRPCNYGSTYNPTLNICQLDEINCNSYQCRGLADKIKIPALTTTEGYCECISGIATYHNCPDNGDFNVATNTCEAPVCDLSKCKESPIFPASNTSFGYCICAEDIGFVSCDEGEMYSDNYKLCIEPCNQLLCTGKPDQYLIKSAINENSFCSCHVGAVAPTYEVCSPEIFIFDESRQMCVGNTEELCGTKLCSGYEIFEAQNTVGGFCLCSAKGVLPAFQDCPPDHIFVLKADACLPTAESVCNIELCADATIEHPLTLLANNSIIQFCYCSGPKNAMLLTCPDGKYYSQPKGKCVKEQEAGDVVCPNDIVESQKVADTTTCNKYSICVDGIMESKTCPDDQYFNVDSNDCVPDTEGTCSAQSACTCLGAYYENEHLKHPVNPHMYYVCKDGSLHEYKCLEPLVYSETQKQCVRNRILRHEPKKRSVDFNADRELVCSENEKRSVPSNCSQYEICLQQIWQRKTCSNYRYYNPEQKKCLEPQDDFVCSYAKLTTLPPCNASLEHQLYRAKTCQQYFRCQEGKWRLESCAHQEYFDSKMSTCLPMSKDQGFQCLLPDNKIREVVKSEKERPLCQHLSQRFYIKNCAMYMICLDNEWWYQYCPQGMFYNRSLNYCVPDVGRQCADVINPKVILDTEEFSKDSCQQDGLLRPSALACNRYFVCLNGKWQMQHCGRKEFYDVTNAKCSPDSEGVCTQINEDCLPTDRRALPRNCSAYEQCSSEGKWLKFTCPQGEIYDDLLQQCSANQGICSRHGLKRACGRQEIMAVSKNCSMFYYCSEDSWNLGNCLKGFMCSPDEQMCIAHTKDDKCQPLFLKKLHKNTLNSSQESQLCLGKPDGTSVAHPFDCSRYYICTQQTTSHEMHCSRGSYFEPNLSYCRPNDGSCRLPLTGVCANAKYESLVAHPSDCQSFYKCSTINGTELFQCPEGQYFHNSSHQCQLDNGECRKDMGPKQKCAGLTHGTRLAHETYCNIYYTCIKGLAIPVECPVNYQFNAILGKCVWNEKHQCPDGQLIERNVTYSCSKFPDGSYLPDRKDCTRYYICSQGQASPKKCSSSSYFDSELLLCVPDDGSCPFVNNDQNNPVTPDPLVCKGKHGHLMVDPFNCNNFYACIHNKLKHERCYTHQFFNVTTQQCQGKFFVENLTNNNTTITDLLAQTAKMQNPQCLDETTPVKQLCSEMSVGTSLAEPGDCRHYITCQEADEEPLLQRCRNGESFDSLLGFCRQNDGTCLLENGQRVGECSGKHGQLTRDPHNCRNYFVCINGQKIAQTCANGEYFSKTQNMCIKDTQNVCFTYVIQPTEETVKQSCAGLSESILYPYIYDNCRSYFQCIKSVAKIHKCADELYFDPLAIKCVKNKTECVMPTQTLQRSPAFRQTFNQLCSDKKFEYPYANLDNDCRSFYTCHANGDVSHELCPLGMIFNKQYLACTAENKTTCE